MQYRIFKRDNTVEVKGLVRSIPDSLKKAEFLLPFSQKEDSVVFLLHGEQTLASFLQYCTEIRFLTCVYAICRCLETVTERSDSLLQFVLDSQYIFFDENESVRGILAPQNSAEQTDYKGFFWNLFFTASFQTKDVPVVREMLGFIRVARAVTPRDLILFIEMSSIGKDILASYNAHAPVSAEPEEQESVKQNEPDPNELQTGNDFSDFLKSFEQPYLYEEEPEDTPQPAQAEYTPADTPEPAYADPLRQDDLLSTGFDAPVSDPLAQAMSEPQDAVLDEPLVEEPAAPQDSVQDEPIIEEPAAPQDVVLDEPLVEKPAAPQDTAPDEPIMDEPFDPQDVVLDEPLVEEPVVPQNVIPNVPPAPPVPEPPRPQPVAPQPPRVQENKPAPANERVVRVNRITPPAQTAPAPQQAVRSVPVQPVMSNPPVLQMQYFLVTTDGRSIPLQKERIHIGRNAQNVDLPVQDMYVSRVHAVITRNASGIYYTDLNPRNPSFINGISISPNTPHALKDEDKIQLGKTVFYLRCVRAER